MPTDRIQIQWYDELSDTSPPSCHVIMLAPLEGSIAYRGAFFGEGEGPIFLERYDCREEDTEFLDCAVPPIGVHSCQHSNDAGVRCIGKVYE